MLWSYLTLKGIGSLYKIEWTLNIVRCFELLRKEFFIILAHFNFDLDEII